MKIRWAKRVIDNLEAEAEYIAQDSPASARRIISRIKKAVNLLSSFPEIGKAGRVKETRELVVKRTPNILPYL